MYVLSAALTGGDGMFASVSEIYNKLAKEDPQLINVLTESNWPFTKYVIRQIRI
jgi:hypothetical protein